VRLQGTLFRIIIINFCVNTIFGLVSNPFTNKKLVFIMIEIRPLAFTEIIDPVSFEVVAVSLCHHTVTVSF
jgi:hypothetical protein